MNQAHFMLNRMRNHLDKCSVFELNLSLFSLYSFFVLYLFFSFGFRNFFHECHTCHIVRGVFSQFRTLDSSDLHCSRSRTFFDCTAFGSCCWDTYGKWNEKLNFFLFRLSYLSVYLCISTSNLPILYSLRFPFFWLTFKCGNFPT